MLVIRKFREEDNAVLASIYLGCRTETFHWVSGDSFKLEDVTNDTLGEVILVAVNDGEIVGFVSLWLPDNFIHHLFIHAKYQKRGAGGRLLDEALRLIGRPARLKCVILESCAKKYLNS